jgi:hypothetical protein
MIALGLLLVLVGFALIVSRGAMPGSAAARNITMGSRSQLFKTAGYKGVPSRRYRVIQVLMGLVVLAGGMVILATST